MPTTPPSFSSFPPSFDSFPHVEDTSSTSSQRRKGFRENDKGNDRKEQKRDRHDKHAKQSHASRERAQRLKTDGYVFDDERIKAEESLLRSTEQQDVLRQAFYSDRKGDPLSMQYGGIYSREVPKYHLVGRE